MIGQRQEQPTGFESWLVGAGFDEPVREKSGVLGSLEPAVSRLDVPGRIGIRLPPDPGDEALV